MYADVALSKWHVSHVGIDSIVHGTCTCVTYPCIVARHIWPQPKFPV